ncbi:phosphate transporter PHO1-2 isoform X1 [Zea mays]|uniref:PHO1-2b n=2 Tax=Zea mays TaxID=4577 RepID=A0A1D6HP11_MAIZE|nr:phosphate transporter PHO1-2 isoform X1 [Zea mays]AQK76013.1 phosphate transporter3 [Zea mays]ASW20331.1 PHO1-2b [Zea mays]|eukprot:XP_008646412.2 phosphate transporter PHO1-2 isoform X1 [Zea mays]
MVKFSREYEASIIPEWKAAFVDYKGLKKLVKRIKIARRDRAARSTSNDHDDATTTTYGFSVLDPVRALASHFNNATPPASPEGGSDDALRSLESDSGELVRATDKHEQEFVERADEELEKVNKFYAAQEADMLARGDALIEQLRILADVKRILADHAAASSRRGRARLARTGGNSSPPSVDGSNSGRHLLSSPFVASSPQSMSDGSVQLQQARVAEGAAVAEEVMAALERNGVSFVGGGLGKAKKDGSGKQLMGRAALLQLPATVRIDIPPTSPGRAALKVWEELVNVLRKDGADPAAAFVHRKKVQHAEKSIRDAFLALYRGLDLLKKFSSLNVKAFTKILKKFVKVSEQHRKGDLFSEKVKRSPFSSSDKVLQLADEVECIFLRHFAGNDRKVAMKYLKPQQPRNTHMVTFLVGLFTGTFVSLFIIYSVLAHVAGIFSSTGNTAYMEIVYHVLSMFALISLHVFLYGCNLSMWKGTRINHNFIFDFSSTALTHRDAFLMSASIMCTVVAALVVNLFLRNAGATYANALPGALLLLSAGVLFCPFNIFYRSTRFCFMRVMRNIVLSPFYKVLMADFFMADQLTSQIPLLRHLEFTGCYFMAETFRTHAYGSCTSSSQYKNLAYVLSFLPYYWRAMQCLRRYLEEGHDMNQLANAGKYVSAMVAAAVRFKYAATPTPFWMWMVIASSTGATIYQLYWDFVMDWGFLNPKSKNFWLRDQLILKNKSIYYASMMLNLVLRLAWAESVMKLRLGMVESRLLDFSLASLEIIRRGHWNFYRLENEHLNNAGKFRAVKTVPLPFRELETD